MGRIVYSILGGDARQRECANILAAEGNSVMVYGIDQEFDNRNIKVFNILNQHFFDCDVLMLPIPYKNNKGYINHVKGIRNLTLSDFVDLIQPTTNLVLGKADVEVRKTSDVYGFKYFDLLADEAFAILNSIPSAEGAIQRAMEKTDITIHGAKVLVLGYGRLGKTLARMLDGIGANVTVEARNSHDIAWIIESGYMGVTLDKIDTILHEQDIIFNTIPALILDKNKLAKLKNSATVIDLASYPGGVDFKAAEELGIQASLELSLPGIVAPKAAAKIICMRMKDLIKD